MAHLPQTYHAEYIIVGAGYAGVSAALELAQNGKQVLLIDALDLEHDLPLLPSPQQSSISGGHVVHGFGQDFRGLEKEYGTVYARDLFALSTYGINLVEQLCQKPELDGAHFRRGHLHLSRSPREDALIALTYTDHLTYGDSADRNDYTVRLLTSDETRAQITSPLFVHTSLYSTLYGQLEPRAYVLGLLQLAKAAGVTFLPSTVMTSFRTDKDGASAVSTKGQTFRAAHMIVSGGTHILCNGHFPRMRAYQARVGNYAVKTEPLPDDLLASIFPSGYCGAFSDLRRSDVLYARLDAQNCLDFGAYSFAGSVPNSAEVENFLYEAFPQLGEAHIGLTQQRFGFLSGTRNESVQLFQSREDGEVIPITRFDPQGRLLVLSAFAAEGISMGTVAGQAAARALLGEPHNLNLLAHIRHKKMPFTLPWESANRVRDDVLASALSIIDRAASREDIFGAGARVIAEMI